MRTFVVERQTFIAQPLESVFAFFSDAHNLERITPPWLHFAVLTPAPIQMRPGALLDYRLSWRGLPLRWRTEISQWQPPIRFVDRQLRGPYRLWVHEHRFRRDGDGTHMSDRVEYSVPGGRLAQRLFVGRDVEAIFDYRQLRIREIFPNQRDERADNEH